MNWKQAARIFRQRWLAAVTIGERLADYAESLERENMRLKDQLTAARLELDILQGEAESAFEAGAAVAFGVTGMVSAVQERERRRPREEDDASYERAMEKLKNRGLAQR